MYAWVLLHDPSEETKPGKKFIPEKIEPNPKKKKCDRDLEGMQA